MSARIDQLNTLGAFPMAYLFIWLGAVLPFRRFARKNDISYEMYIYGFPVAQLLVLAHGNRLPVAVTAARDVLVTIPFALASWFLIERPAQLLAPRFDRQRRRGRSLRRRG